MKIKKPKKNKAERQAAARKNEQSAAGRRNERARRKLAVTLAQQEQRA